MLEHQRRARRDAIPTTPTARAAAPEPANDASGVPPGGPVQDALGGVLADAVSLRATRDVLMRQPLLLADRPWEKIEAEQRRRARRPFEEDEEPLFPLPQFPITIELPGPPLRLTDRPWEQIEDERRELRDAKDALRPVWAEYVKLAKQMKQLDVVPAEFKRLRVAAMAAVKKAAAQPTAESITATEQAAAAALKWAAGERSKVAKQRYEAKNSNPGVVKRFMEKVQALASIVNAVRGSLTNSTKKKKPALDNLAAAVQALEDDVRGRGVSQANGAQLALLTAQVHEAAKGVTIKQEYCAQAKLLANDPDDDGRTGNENSLTYGGHSYDKVPGFDSPPLYGRIDNTKLLLLDEPLEAYTAAMHIGRIPPNEQGASGVKEKALHWEIKLIARTARRLMGDSDLRIRNNQSERNGKLQTTTKGVTIRYLVFDDRYNAH